MPSAGPAARLDPRGKVVWGSGSTAMNSTSLSHSSATALAVALDGTGHITVLGVFMGKVQVGTTIINGTAKNYSDIFVARWDTSGKFKWAKTGGAPVDDEVGAIATDPAGNSYITGSASGVATFGSVTLVSKSPYRRPFVVRISSKGTFDWGVAPTGSGLGHGLGIALWGTNPMSCHVTGDLKGELTFAKTVTSSGIDGFVTRIKGAGTTTWAYDWTVMLDGKQTARGLSLAADAAGNSYVAGQFSQSITFGSTTLSSAGGTDGFVAKLDGSGKPVWANSFGGSGEDLPVDIALDAQGNSYLAGYFHGTAAFGAAAVLKTGSGTYQGPFASRVNPSGSFVWAAGAADTYKGEGHGVGVDGKGHVYTAGWFSGTYVKFGKATFAGGSGNRSFLWKVLASGP